MATATESRETAGLFGSDKVVCCLCCTELGGYRVNLTEAQLQDAPKYSGDSWDWEDRDRARQVSDYYGSPWTGF